MSLIEWREGRPHCRLKRRRDRGRSDGHEVNIHEADDMSER